MSFDNLLVVLDKEKHQQSALKRALQLAQSGAVIRPVSFIWNGLAENRNAYDSKQRRAIKQDILQHHRAWLGRLSSERPDMPKVKVVWGHDLDTWIGQNCDGIDLVVKTAHKSRSGHSALDWQLLNSCPAPLLLVGHKRVRRPRTILAALDLAHDDRQHRRLNCKVLDTACELAGMTDAQVNVVNVTEVSQVLSDLDVVNVAEVRKRVAAQAQPHLGALVRTYDIKAKQVHQPVGRVGHAIAQTARDLNADLLVVGSCVHRFKQAIGLGNSAQKILTRAPCDILAVHP